MDIRSDLEGGICIRLIRVMVSYTTTYFGCEGLGPHSLVSSLSSSPDLGSLGEFFEPVFPYPPRPPLLGGSE